MGTEVDRLQLFLAPHTSQWEQIVDWPLARFAVNSYLCRQLPPDSYITSVRAIVLHQTPEMKNAVLVVQDPDGYHIVPGGRREAGETLSETATREVMEETGWQVNIRDVLGFMHFQRLTPLPPAAQITDAAFVQLVYCAEAEQYRGEGKEVNGYEVDAHFVALDQLNEYNISQGECLFLEAALAQINNKE